MTRRGWVMLWLGGGLLTIGLLALNFPVFLDAYDNWGLQVSCGTGYITKLDQANIAEHVSPHTSFVDQCQSALAVRRAWAIPLALAGWAVLSGIAVALWRHTAPDAEHADAH